MKTTRYGLTAAAVLGLGVLSACRDDRSSEPPRQFLPDMDDSPKWKPQTKSEFFTDGRAMRQPVAGTVAFGSSTDATDPARAKYLKADAVFATGKDSKGDVVPYMPESAIAAFMPADGTDKAAAITAMLERGQERFNIYCTPCHGFDAKGKGTVGQRFTVAPANLHDDKFRDRKVVTGSDGHIFDVIRNGWNNGSMPPYGHAVNEKDAWAIAMYVRALQASTASKPGDIPAAELGKIDSARPAPAATPATPAADPHPTEPHTHDPSTGAPKVTPKEGTPKP